MYLFSLITSCWEQIGMGGEINIKSIYFRCQYRVINNTSFLRDLESCMVMTLRSGWRVKPTIKTGWNPENGNIVMIVSKSQFCPSVTPITEFWISSVRCRSWELYQNHWPSSYIFKKKKKKLMTWLFRWGLVGTFLVSSYSNKRIL